MLCLTRCFFKAIGLQHRPCTLQIAARADALSSLDHAALLQGPCGPGSQAGQAGHLRALAQSPLMLPAPAADHVRVQGFHIGAHTVGHQPQQITQGASPQGKVEAAADRDGEEGKGFRGLMQLCTAVSMGNFSPQMVSCLPSCCCIDHFQLLLPLSSHKRAA